MKNKSFTWQEEIMITEQIADTLAREPQPVTVDQKSMIFSSVYFDGSEKINFSIRRGFKSSRSSGEEFYFILTVGQGKKTATIKVYEHSDRYAFIEKQIYEIITALPVEPSEKPFNFPDELRSPGWHND